MLRTKSLLGEAERYVRAVDDEIARQRRDAMLVALAENKDLIPNKRIAETVNKFCGTKYDPAVVHLETRRAMKGLDRRRK